MADKILNLSRLQAQLLTSGLQIKDNALYQVINQLLVALIQLQKIIDGFSNSSGSVVVNSNSNLFAFPGLDGDDGIDGIQGPPGNTGSIGPSGATGPVGFGFPGLDGEDGSNGFPGPAGNTGAAGTNRTTSFGITIDGGGAVIATGIKGDIYFPVSCTIIAVTMLADQSGSIVVDLWKDTYANYPPTVADTITAAAKPTITTATKSQDSTLTGWTTSVNAGDTIRFNVDSVSTITRLAASFTVTVP